MPLPLCPTLDAPIDKPIATGSPRDLAMAALVSVRLGRIIGKEYSAQFWSNLPGPAA
ncbi:hypothetical protein K2X14_10530 [Acetobacter sp. TBRC 12305]|uniref:hypothetical protein n=1 Tax=Acetobacter garciniae TaxID=2817435 RepID=UPI001C73DB27|nr:hypothetical protein [Acetobacter garciniae]MBX0345270.1 hypothetical protein [Acetobacter garciniae]